MINLIYVISILLLLISYLVIYKCNRLLSIVREVIIGICLIYCYNTLIVYILYLLNVGGSIIIYTIINISISFILLIFSLLKKRLQKYYFNKKELICVISFTVLLSIIGYLRFHGGKLIHYESVDASIHYREALQFSKSLSILDGSNTNDIVYGTFERSMPISYINGGFLIKILSNIKSYRVFMIHDTLSYIVASLLFLVTLFKVFSKKDYFYIIVLEFLYSFGFIFNSYIFGFSYLTLGVMVCNLLLIFIYNFNGYFGENKLFKILILSLVNFSVFYSYYLFIPCIYLSLGLYYIYLYRVKRIGFKLMMVYGIFTLIIPFLIGFIYFLVPILFTSNGISSVIALPGYIYDNNTPSYFYILFVFYLIFIERMVNKVKDYFDINFIVILVYIGIFLILFIIRLSGVYYFHKLFYLFWIYFIIYLGKRFNRYKKCLIIFSLLILISMIYIRIDDNSRFGDILSKLNVYNWNAHSFNSNRTLINENELKLIEESIKYKDICEVNDEFLNIGKRTRNYWFYAITGSIPLSNYDRNNSNQLNLDNITYSKWRYDGLEDYPCVVYFYDNIYTNLDYSTYTVLYQNSDGVILKR